MAYTKTGCRFGATACFLYVLALYIYITNPSGRMAPFFTTTIPSLMVYREVIGIFQLITSIDAYIIAYAAILINNGILNIAAVANTQGRQSTFRGMGHLFDGLIIVCPHQVTAHNGGAITNTAANTNYAVLNAAGIDDTTFRNNSFFEGGATDLGRGQHAGTGIDCIGIVEQVEGRYLISEGQVGLKEG